MYSTENKGENQGRQEIPGIRAPTQHSGRITALQQAHSIQSRLEQEDMSYQEGDVQGEK